MRRFARFLAIALPAALTTVAVALSAADPASGGPERGPRTAIPAPSTPPERATTPQERTTTPPPARQERTTTPPPALIVRVRPGATVQLRSRPHGPTVASAGDTTEFGSPRRLGVVSRQGRWLGVTTPDLPNGTLGWVDRRSTAVRIERTRWSIHADLSKRTIVLRRAGRRVRRLSVAVGRPGSPTPTGRFAVTDELSGGDYGPYYGCCILALSATQPNTPPGWTGGDRMAIHGTSDPASIGAAASAGCLRAADDDLGLLMSRVPVGTPVSIRR